MALSLIRSLVLPDDCRAQTRPSATGGPPVERDSAGVHLIEYASMRDAPRAFVIESAPVFDLGGLHDGGPEEFNAGHPWLSTVTLSNGTIVVTDWAELKYFDQRGRFLKVAGRRGHGPGEFWQTREACVIHGDSVLAVDYSDGRLSLWSPQGEFIRAWQRPGPVTQGGCFPDGTVILIQFGDGGRAGGLPTQGPDPRVLHVRARPDGSVIKPLGRFPLERTSGPFWIRVSVLPFGGDNLIVADGGTSEIQLYDGSGALTRVIRILERPRPLSSSERRRHVESTIPRGTPRAERERRIAVALAQPPGTPPGFGFVRVDAGNRIWVQDGQVSRRWYVFDARGLLIGSVDLPNLGSSSPSRPPPTLVSIGVDRVAMVWRDADGAAHVSFHRLRPGPPA